MADIKHLTAQPPQVVVLGLHHGIIQSMLDYEYMSGRAHTTIRAVVASNRKQERFFWGESEIIMPVYPSINKLPAAHAKVANTVLNLQSARRVLRSVEEAVAAFPQLHTVSIFAEQVPETHAIKLSALAETHNLLVAGPASVGILVPGAIKLGAIGGITPLQIANANITDKGDVAVISTSGGMVNELIHTVTHTANRISFAIAMGGDRFPVLTPAQALLIAERDKATKAIVYFGELGGQDEYEIADLLAAKKITKPLHAYIAGEVATLFEAPPQFGHAKAMARNLEETAAAKKQALRTAGALVADSIQDIATAMQARKGAITPAPSRPIGSRTKKMITSRLSGDVGGAVHLLGRELGETIESMPFEGLVISMLLGHNVQDAPRLAAFTNYVLRLLVDHGPYVSGALNTITAARAGRDLVSSLSAGLLTVGPRFGGAINEAACSWLHGVQAGLSPRDFVEQHGGIILGIGHKKYRIDAPDPRVARLREFAGNSNGDRYLNFALGVEKVTTAKKGNLILNVDGCIAAMLLDMLESELGYSHEQLEELVSIEFFNAIFVLSRSVGFMAHYMDQRRNDEGLLRFSEDHISYIP